MAFIQERLLAITKELDGIEFEKQESGIRIFELEKCAEGYHLRRRVKAAVGAEPRLPQIARRVQNLVDEIRKHPEKYSQSTMRDLLQARSRVGLLRDLVKEEKDKKRSSENVEQCCGGILCCLIPAIFAFASYEWGK